MEVTEKITNLVKKAMNEGLFPGASFAVLSGKDSHEKVIGYASLEPRETLLKPGMLWDLASVSKVVGVGSVLIERIFSGKLALDTSLKTYYPDWWEDSVTLRQLLTHTSGINPRIEGRNQMAAKELTDAMNHLEVRANKSFQYTDVNFILLGFMLEALEQKTLSQILRQEVFLPLKMRETQFAPVAKERAVPTWKGLEAGQVHDPKARVLGNHCGSAGLFSTLSDLTAFAQAYLQNPTTKHLLSNYALIPGKMRSLAWDLQDQEWLLHTGYTGTFILMNPLRQKAVIFLSNRVHLKDEREKWIEKRDVLIEQMKNALLNDAD